MQYRRAPWMTGACKDMPHRQNEPRVAHIQIEQVWSARRANCELLISARPAGHCTWTPQRGPRSTLPSDHSKGGDAEEERSTFQDSCASESAGGWCSWDVGHRGGLGPGLWGAAHREVTSCTHHSKNPPALRWAIPHARIALTSRLFTLGSANFEELPKHICSASVPPRSPGANCRLSLLAGRLRTTPLARPQPSRGCASLAPRSRTCG